jgi:prepilin-type N-terminal cleavage/methylation domain-containing protein
MNYKLRKSRAFTLIELVVSIAILVMVISFAGVVFKVSINAHRTATANTEIMQKLRAITDQLNTDFKDVRRDAPLMIWFFQDETDPDQRYDQIMSFADGDFQSTQLYGDNGVDPFLVPLTTGVPIRGNIARIYYGQARIYAPMSGSFIYPWFQKGLDRQERILSRRRHILTSDIRLDVWPGPDPGNLETTFDTQFGGYKKNDFYEHDRLSLAQWKTVDRVAYDGLLGGPPVGILNACFDLRTIFDTRDPNTFQRLMCKGVSSFSIQWAYWDPAYAKFHWFPSNDPDGDGNPVDSHFELMRGFPMGTVPGFIAFGTFFNIPTGQINFWGPVSEMIYAYDFTSNSPKKFAVDFFPKALKFTFTLHESRGIIKGGRTFTHIVYLGD